MNFLWQATKTVFAKKRYMVIATAFSFLVFSLNIGIKNIPLLKTQPSIFLSLLIAAPHTMTTFSLTLLTVLALLGGITTAFSAFLIRRQLAAGVGGGLSGILTALLVPACPSCAVGAIGLFGIGGLLTFLPFQGLEIGVGGIILLGVVLVYMAKKINATVCVR